MEHDPRLQRPLLDAEAGAKPAKAPGAAFTDSDRMPATISACSHAVLVHYGIDPTDLFELSAAAFRAGIEIRDVQSPGARLTMTIILPMDWSERRITIRTNGPTYVSLPGVTFSPAIAAAAVGRPVGRLVGHPALDLCSDLLVTSVEQAQEAGVRSAILHFRDGTRPLEC
jgi:hypothetical protein